MGVKRTMGLFSLNLGIPISSRSYSIKNIGIPVSQGGPRYANQKLLSLQYPYPIWAQHSWQRKKSTARRELTSIPDQTFQCTK